MTTTPDQPYITMDDLLTWLTDEKELLQKDHKTVQARFGTEMARHISAGITTLETLIDKVTNQTFEQLDRKAKP